MSLTLFVDGDAMWHSKPDVDCNIVFGLHQVYIIATIRSNQLDVLIPKAPVSVDATDTGKNDGYTRQPAQ